MEKNLFDRLVESMTEMDEIDRGERQPSREFHIDAVQVK
ncbi:transcriptional regulator, partial [Pseudomonas syringae]|nr:transcriptional regulator [Pseudomonas syringae]